MSAALCPYCREALHTPETTTIFCTSCGTPHHADCYEENGGCTVFGCQAAPADEPKLSVLESEVLHVAAPPPLVNGEPGGTAPPHRTPPPPPPLPRTTHLGEGWKPPRYQTGNTPFGTETPRPQEQLGSPARSEPQTYLDDSSVTAKSRTTFIVLGVLLGPLGAHNFFAGYRNKAFTQLLITVLTLGLASPMTWVWAVIDVCTVERDSSGVAFVS